MSQLNVTKMIEENKRGLRLFPADGSMPSPTRTLVETFLCVLAGPRRNAEVEAMDAEEAMAKAIANCPRVQIGMKGGVQKAKKNPVKFESLFEGRVRIFLPSDERTLVSLINNSYLPHHSKQHPGDRFQRPFKTFSSHTHGFVKRRGAGVAALRVVAQFERHETFRDRLRNTHVPVCFRAVPNKVTQSPPPRVHRGRVAHCQRIRRGRIWALHVPYAAQQVNLRTALPAATASTRGSWAVLFLIYLSDSRARSTRT